jgi:hypothetical protein
MSLLICECQSFIKDESSRTKFAPGIMEWLKLFASTVDGSTDLFYSQKIRHIASRGDQNNTNVSRPSYPLQIADESEPNLQEAYQQHNV